MRSTQDYAVRELDRRQSDGLDVALIWESPADRLFVAVTDLRGDRRFRIPVQARHALDAFTHPYAYYRGDLRHDTPTVGSPERP